MLVDSEIYAVRSCDKIKIASELREFVASSNFPCVGAKAALRRHQLEILVAPDIRHGGSDKMITRRLQDFAIRHDADDKMFVSQAVIFQNDADLSEAAFETHLWQRLTSLHAIDRQDYQWDPNVDSDPQVPAFQSQHRRQRLLRRRPASQCQSRRAPLQASHAGLQSACAVREAAAGGTLRNHSQQDDRARYRSAGLGQSHARASWPGLRRNAVQRPRREQRLEVSVQT